MPRLTGSQPNSQNSFRICPLSVGAGQRLDGPCWKARRSTFRDVLADPEYKWAEAQRLGGYRTMLGVPMLRENVRSEF